MTRSWTGLFAGFVFAMSGMAHAQLPKNFLTWDAQRKSDYLWEKKILVNQYRTLPPIQGWGWEGLWKSAKAAFSLSESFDHDSDEMPEGRPKIFHPMGSVAQFELVGDSNSGYDGALGGSVGLVRFSLGADPKTFGGYLPGMALKFMVDGQPSENVHLLNSIEGQGDDRNLFARPLSNHLPEPESMSFRFILKNLKALLGLDPLHVNVDHLSHSKKPVRVVFYPAPGVATDSNSPNDFREDLAKLPAGVTLYEVYASESMEGELVHVGKMVLKTQFVASEYGDQQLFFRHRR